MSRLFHGRSPPQLLTAAAHGCLEPSPASRLRRTYLHLLYSMRLLRFLDTSRPVHLWGSPLDYGPVLLRMPFGSHLTVDTLPSGDLQTAASGPPWLYPAFAFVPG